MLTSLAQKIRAKGASDCDLVHRVETDAEAKVRLGVLEDATFSSAEHVSIRVIVGKKSAVVTTSRLDDVEALLTRAFSMAASVPEDRFLVRSSSDMWFQGNNTLPVDTRTLEMDDLVRRAETLERAALDHDGINGSDGASAGYGHSVTTLVTGGGFYGQHRASTYGMSVALLAGAEGARQVDGYGAAAMNLDDLEDETVVANKAAHRVLRKQNPKRAVTGHYPVLFENKIAPMLMRHLLAAIHGGKVCEGMSFLQKARGTQVFAKGVHIIDDPHVPYGFGACLFDGEGLPTRKTPLVQDGVLETWLLNMRFAQKLDLPSTAHATWPAGGPPGIAAHHVNVLAGDKTPQALMQEMQNGLLVTEIMESGGGVNLLTGDYSVGAAGLWIEGGEVAYPVDQVTIVGRLQEMFASLTPANDLEMRGSLNAPSLLIEKMTVSSL